MNNITPTSTEKIFKLINHFPCLRSKVENWQVKKFDPDLFLEIMTGASHGEHLCALFIVNVWNPAYAKKKGWDFDLMEFVGTCDLVSRTCLVEWVLNPVWP